MRKNRWKHLLLCTGIMAAVLAGCGAADKEKTAEGAQTDARAEAEETKQPGQQESAQDAESADGQQESVQDAESAGGKQDGTASADQGAQEVEEGGKKVDLSGLSMSVMGDSISTFDGWIPEGCAVFFPENGEVTDVSQTWWHQLMDSTGMELCTNASSSGSTCVGDSLSIDNPKYGCSDYRVSLLAGSQGKMPDIIIVYMGINDLLTGAPMGDNDGTQMVNEGEVDTFSDAYSLMLDKLASVYPISTVYCCSLTQIGDWGTEQPFVTFVNSQGLTAEDYSERIRVIAENKGAEVIDLYNCGIEIDNLQEMTSDGVHLTPEGMKRLAEAMEEAIAR